MAAWQRIGIGGHPGTGKTRTALTAQKSVEIVYCDRRGGEIDLTDMEDIGVKVHMVNTNDPRTSALAILNEIRTVGIPKRGVRHVHYDSVSFAQSHQMSKDTSHNRNSMNLKKYGMTGNSIQDVLDVLFDMPCHVSITFHVKEERIVENEKQIGVIWKPDLMPAVAKRINKECGLIGYTWKRVVNGQSVFGVSFLEEMPGKVGVMRFECAKAPAGWGAKEPPDISKWIKRLDDDAKKHKQAARDAALNGAEAPPAEAIKPINTEPEQAAPADLDNIE